MRFHLKPSLVILALFCCCFCGSRQPRPEKVVSYQPSNEGASELLSAVLFHIKKDYVIAIDERPMLRSAMQYLAKNYGEQLTIGFTEKELEVVCSGKKNKLPIPPDTIEEINIVKFYAMQCLSARAKTEFKFYDIALAAALIKVLPLPGHFHTRKDMEEFEKETRGDFASLGFELRKEAGDVVIVKTLPESPAQAAGIRSDSVLRKVDGIDVSALSLTDVIRKIRGAEGSNVLIEVETKQQTQSYTLARKKIPLAPASATSINGRIMLLQIKQLNYEAGDIVKRALADAPSGTTAVIVDLRGSPGGLLEGIRSVTTPLVRGGVLFETRGRRSALDKQFFAGNEAYLEDRPVYVLTDEHTAAGSEMVALVLQLRRGAKIYGRATRGKGEVENVITLMYGNAIQLPIQEMYRSDGLMMRSNPVKPDVEVAVNEDILKRVLRDIPQKK